MGVLRQSKHELAAAIQARSLKAARADKGGSWTSSWRRRAPLHDGHSGSGKHTGRACTVGTVDSTLTAATAPERHSHASEEAPVASARRGKRVRATAMAAVVTGDRVVHARGAVNAADDGGG